jgi:hypothetical protein
MKRALAMRAGASNAPNGRSTVNPFATLYALHSSTNPRRAVARTLPCAAAFHARRSMTLISACELHRATSMRPLGTTQLSCYKKRDRDGNSCKRRSPLFSGGLQLTSSARRSGLATACGLVLATIRGLSRSGAFEPNFRSATATFLAG